MLQINSVRQTQTAEIGVPQLDCKVDWVGQTGIWMDGKKKKSQMTNKLQK